MESVRAELLNSLPLAPWMSDLPCPSCGTGLKAFNARVLGGDSAPPYSITVKDPTNGIPQVLTYAAESLPAGDYWMHCENQKCIIHCLVLCIPDQWDGSIHDCSDIARFGA